MAPLNYFKVFEGKDHQWYWHFVNGSNGKIQAAGEGYTTEGHAERGVDDFRQAVTHADNEIRREEKSTEDAEEE